MGKWPDNVIDLEVERLRRRALANAGDPLNWFGGPSWKGIVVDASPGPLTKVMIERAAQVAARGGLVSYSEAFEKETEALRWQIEALDQAFRLPTLHGDQRPKRGVHLSLCLEDVEGEGEDVCDEL
jgi:hypothetical protein